MNKKNYTGSKTNDVKVDVILLCGGKGTRFTSVTGDKLPKSLYKVKDKELICYTLDTLSSTAAIGRLIFAIDHHADMMTKWIHGQNFSIETVISKQAMPGIVAAVRSAMAHLTSSHFILCNTDEIRIGFDAGSFIAKGFRPDRIHDGVMATARARNLFRHRVIEANSLGMVTATMLKGEKYKQSPETEGVINTGFLLLPKSIINTLDENCGDGWDSIINPLVEQGRMRTLFSPSVKYFNVGTSFELDATIEFLNNAASIPPY